MKQNSDINRASGKRIVCGGEHLFFYHCICQDNIYHNITKFQINLISNVSVGYFRNLTDLDTIALSENLISDIDDYSFAEVPSVRTIFLANNELQVIREHTFSGLPS